MERQTPTHIIRLQRAWSHCAVAPDATSNFVNGERFTRRFGRPSGLDESARVMLCGGHSGRHVVVRINGRVIGEISAQQRSWECDITPFLLPRNELWLDLDLPVPQDRQAVCSPARRCDLPHEIVDSIRLEIHHAPVS